jgi:hypothetical protein
VQSGLTTVGACRAFELLVETRCALEDFSLCYQAGSEQSPGSFDGRDRRYHEVMAGVRRRNAYTELQLLHFAACCCKVELQPEDSARLEKLRQIDIRTHGVVTNYAAQAHQLQTKETSSVWPEYMQLLIPRSSLYFVWPLDNVLMPAWFWLREIRSPLLGPSTQSDDHKQAPANPEYLIMCDTSDTDQLLYSDLFASWTGIDPKFAHLVDQNSWRARMDQAASSTLFCVCSLCEEAEADGRPVPHARARN